MICFDELALYSPWRRLGLALPPTTTEHEQLSHALDHLPQNNFPLQIRTVPEETAKKNFQFILSCVSSDLLDSRFQRLQEVHKGAI